MDLCLSLAASLQRHWPYLHWALTGVADQATLPRPLPLKLPQSRKLCVFLTTLPQRDAVVYSPIRRAPYNKSICPPSVTTPPTMREHWLIGSLKETSGLYSNGPLPMLELWEMFVLTTSLLTRTTPAKSMLTGHLMPVGLSVDSNLFYANTTQEL